MFCRARANLIAAQGHFPGIGWSVFAIGFLAYNLDPELGSEPNNGANQRKPRRRENDSPSYNGAGREWHGDDDVPAVGFEQKPTNVAFGKQPGNLVGNLLPSDFQFLRDGTGLRFFRAAVAAARAQA